ncbi:hypothetical protein HK104_000767 [Borealophlyctis nickersoniae]|nr:hypothetical protein HK104_000767 [Borealophlyctis nickersoniae]
MPHADEELGILKSADDAMVAGDWEKAERLLERFFEKDRPQEDGLFIRWRILIVLIQIRTKPESGSSKATPPNLSAIRCIEKILAIKSPDPNELYNASVALVQLVGQHVHTSGKQIADVLAGFAKALEEAKDSDLEWRIFLHATVANMLGKVESSKGDAQKHFAKAIALAKSSPAAGYLLLPVYQRMSSLGSKPASGSRHDPIFALVSDVQQIQETGSGDPKVQQLMSNLESAIRSIKSGPPPSMEHIDLRPLSLELAKQALNRGLVVSAERLLMSLGMQNPGTDTATRKRLLEAELLVRKSQGDASDPTMNLKYLEALQSAVKASLQLNSPHIIAEGCVAMWNAILPIIGDHRTCFPYLKLICDALDCCNSTLELRPKAHFELANYCELRSLLPLCRTHLQKAHDLYHARDDFWEDLCATCYRVDVKLSSTFDESLASEVKALSLVLNYPEQRFNTKFFFEAMRILVPDYEATSFDLTTALSRQYTFVWDPEALENQQRRKNIFFTFKELMELSNSKAKTLKTGTQKNHLLFIAFECASYLQHQNWDINVAGSFSCRILSESAIIGAQSLRDLCQEDSDHLLSAVSMLFIKALKLGVQLSNNWIMRRASAALWNVYINSTAKAKRFPLWGDIFAQVYEKLSVSNLRDSVIFVNICTGYAQVLLASELDYAPAAPAQPVDRASEEKGGGKSKPQKVTTKPAASRDSASSGMKLADEICRAGMEAKCAEYEAKASLMQTWRQICALRGANLPAFPDPALKIFATIETLDTPKDGGSSLVSATQELRHLKDTLPGSLQLQLWLQIYVCFYEFSCGQVLLASLASKVPDSALPIRLRAIEHFVTCIEKCCLQEPVLDDMLSSAINWLWNAAVAMLSAKALLLDHLRKALKSVFKTRYQFKPPVFDIIYKLVQLCIDICFETKSFEIGLRLFDQAAKMMPAVYQQELALQKVSLLGSKGVASITTTVKDVAEEAATWQTLARSLTDPNKKGEAYRTAIETLEKDPSLGIKQAEVLVEHAAWRASQLDTAKAFELLSQAEEKTFLASSGKADARVQLLLLDLYTLRTRLAIARRDQISTLLTASTHVSYIIKRIFERAAEAAETAARLAAQSVPAKSKTKPAQADAESYDMPEWNQWHTYSWPALIQRTALESLESIMPSKQSVRRPVDVVFCLRHLAERMLFFEEYAIKCLPIVSLMELVAEMSAGDVIYGHLKSTVSLFRACTLMHLGYKEEGRRLYKSAPPLNPLTHGENPISNENAAILRKLWFWQATCLFTGGDFELAREYVTQGLGLPAAKADQRLANREAAILHAVGLTLSGQYRQSQICLRELEMDQDLHSFIRASYLLILNRACDTGPSPNVAAVGKCVQLINSVIDQSTELVLSSPPMVAYHHQLLRIACHLLMTVPTKSPQAVLSELNYVFEKRMERISASENPKLYCEILLDQAKALSLRRTQEMKPERRRLLQVRNILLEARRMLETAQEQSSRIYKSVIVELAATLLDIALLPDYREKSPRTLTDMLDDMENRGRDEMESGNWASAKLTALDTAIELLQSQKDAPISKTKVHFVLGMSYFFKPMRQPTPGSAGASRRQSVAPAPPVDNKKLGETHLLTALQAASEDMDFGIMAKIAETLLAKDDAETGGGLDSFPVFGNLCLFHSAVVGEYLYGVWRDGYMHVENLKKFLRTPYDEFPGLPFWKNCAKSVLDKALTFHSTNDIGYQRCRIVPSTAIREWPANVRVIILQHSTDKSKLYGGYLRRKPDLKAKKGDDPIVDTMVLHVPVDFSKLVDLKNSLSGNRAEENQKQGEKDNLTLKHLLSELEDYLRPLIAGLIKEDMAGETVPTVAPSKKKPPKDEVEVEDRTHYVILADEHLESFPLEAILATLASAKSCSRDFSFHVLQDRIRGLAPEPLGDVPKKKDKDKSADTDRDGPEISSLSYVADPSVDVDFVREQVAQRNLAGKIEGIHSKLGPGEYLQFVQKSAAVLMLGPSFGEEYRQALAHKDLRETRLCIIVNSPQPRGRPAEKCTFESAKRLAASLSLSGIDSVFASIGNLDIAEMESLLRRILDGKPGLGKTTVEIPASDTAKTRHCIYGLVPSFIWSGNGPRS